MRNKGSSATGILIGLLIVASSLLLVYLISMAMVGIFDTYGKIAVELQKKSMQETRLATLKELEKKADELQARQERVMKLIPAAAEEAALIAGLEDLSMQSASSFVKIQFEEQKAGEALVEMPVKLSFSGDYQSFLVLMEKIRESERLIRVDEVVVGRPDPLSADIRSEIAARTFYQPQPAK